ncbi:uncharacterized protein LOC109994563 [Xyrichtys novacula]|uniref:Uncharacterized protein LOC109994563 n=1 Tax=Xyrichtys novacula TaxID=13765 RepID=A0AAV1ESE5_XYRNO|nr:uncharacterized protein LOC109994563 [Xyrichtys novacula]
MDQKWTQILMMLVFCQKITTGACQDIVLREQQSYSIKCDIQGPGSTIVWFRVLDTAGIEFIVSFNAIGDLKHPSSLFSSIFSYSKGKHNTLTLNAFSKARDSGVYSCASLKGYELKFGPVTRLVGEKIKVATEAPAIPTKPPSCTTAAPCVCDHKTEQEEETSFLMLCPPIVLGPLVGGCGLLLLLLIITALYCNKIRTRRCPHHHKRKPRPMPPGKQAMPNRRM